MLTTKNDNREALDSKQKIKEIEKNLNKYNFTEDLKNTYF